ncbi:MAG TPA: hypothetical protein VGD40_11905 [Chryseosolibacter sp.]
MEYVKKAIAGFVVLGSIIIIAFAFWQQGMKYSLRTPVANGYCEALPSEEVQLSPLFENNLSYFLPSHNTACQCPQFNARHIKSLVGNYWGSLPFISVVSELASLKRAKIEFGHDLHYLHDKRHSVAKARGLYSAPQAAIVTSEQKPFYRSNCNRARYCTSRASNFAEVALSALLNEQPAPAFGLSASEAYGCELTQNEIEFF